MSIWKEDAASITWLRVPSGPPAKGNEVKLSSMISSAPPAQADYVEMTKEVRKAICVVIYINWRVMELDEVQALQSRGLLVDRVQVQWNPQGGPQYAFVSACSNDENEITMVPRPHGQRVKKARSRPELTGFLREK